WMLLAVPIRWTQRKEVLGINKVLRETNLASQSHDHVGRDIRMMSKSGEHTFENLVVESFEREPTSSFVGDREDTVDIGELLPPGSIAKAIGDRARGAGRAVDRADHGDVVAGSDATIGPKEAAKSQGAIGNGRGDLFSGERVVALKQIGFQIVHMDLRA